MTEVNETTGSGGFGMDSVPHTTALGRVADAGEVAKSALLLAWDDSTYSTGSGFAIDSRVTD